MDSVTREDHSPTFVNMKGTWQARSLSAGQWAWSLTCYHFLTGQQIDSWPARSLSCFQLKVKFGHYFLETVKNAMPFYYTSNWKSNLVTTPSKLSKMLRPSTIFSTESQIWSLLPQNCRKCYASSIYVFLRYLSACGRQIITHRIHKHFKK